MSSLYKHRKIEGLVPTFSILIFIAIMVGTLVELLPIFLMNDQAPKIASVKPLTPLEQAGRDLYIKEGCVSCHSQMIRPFRDEIERYGDYTKAGETIYEHPFLWGSKRTGPDLARIGGKYPNLWHARHMEDPRSTSPSSIMPPYPWLFVKELDLKRLPSDLLTLQKLGVPYSNQEIDNAISMAQIQAKALGEDIAKNGGAKHLANKEIIAIIAYLQRLGQDIKPKP